MGLAVAGTIMLIAAGQTVAGAKELLDDQGHPVMIKAEAFQPRAGDDTVPFTRYDGNVFGMHQANAFSPADHLPPFFNGGGISSGDIDRDGWPDVVSANGPQISIFMNQQGRRFEKLEIEVSDSSYAAIFNVALIDINGDGWLDLFGTSYLDGNFYFLSDKGEFTKAGLKKPPRGEAVLSLSSSFGDVDRDGDLDVIIGNWFAGMGKQHPPPRSQNEIWIYKEAGFEAKPLPGLVGETLSSLLSDWNGDGKLDLIVGNDFDAPDFYYLGDGKGGFEAVQRQAGIIPQTTHSTMSIDTGDFDNDLDLDIFLDQITARATGPSARMPVLALDDYCNDIVMATERNRCLVNMATRRSFFYGPNHRPDNVRKCAVLTDKSDEFSCVGMQVMMTAQRNMKPDICEAIPASESRTYSMCLNFFEPVQPHEKAVLEQAIPQRMNQNVLLAWDSEQGHFTDKAEQAGVGFTGWSWNARFADVDNDEWQDIYVVAGSWFRATPSGTTANFFFHNEAGKKFSDQTGVFGLQNNMIVSAYTVVDFDKDGDLDFVTNSINGPLWLLRNNAAVGNSIVFQLHDEIGNRDGIGTKFTIHYGNDSLRHQMRELKASGGYLSFDEPSAHFGLGKYDQVDRLEVNWSTGGSTIIPGPLKAGHIYALKRLKKMTTVTDSDDVGGIKR
jgi:hypothetical protein